jgi:pilus assembly protein CpaB
MKNILGNRTIIGIACIVLSLIICFALTPMYNNAITAKIEVVRLNADIGKGEVITKDMLQSVEIGEYNLPDSILKEPINIIGKYAKSDLYKGDYLMANKLSDGPLVNYAYLHDFDGSDRAISVTIKSFAAGLSGKLEPGDIVSVIVSDYGELKETINPVELQYVQVLAVTSKTGLDTEESQNSSKGNIEDDKELPSTITLKVAPEQASLLAELENKGKMHVVFVYRGSNDYCDEFLDEQENVLEEIRLQKEEEKRLIEEQLLVDDELADDTSEGDGNADE